MSELTKEEEETRKAIQDWEGVCMIIPEECTGPIIFREPCRLGKAVLTKVERGWTAEVNDEEILIQPGQTLQVFKNLEVTVRDKAPKGFGTRSGNSRPYDQPPVNKSVDR